MDKEYDLIIFGSTQYLYIIFFKVLLNLLKYDIKYFNNRKFNTRKYGKLGAIMPLFYYQ